LSTHQNAPGKQQSLDSLLRGIHRRVFVGGVMVLGTAVPALLAFVGATTSGIREVAAMISFALLLPGGLMLRLTTLRVGIFPPVHIQSK